MKQDVKDDPRAAEYWKSRYEQERERLVKLWVAYKALESETNEPSGN